ncbi:hypothetical protein CIW83_18340 [Tissierella sp. P1]|uniref:hypothetical protein n=1 Tax=Tissierella sp. P1 TaxID=1280483 RepID=UPI000BA0AD1D|nr:hypothetical protein [Tissierella sp. P1]OZV10779.1 hypothetical protein CIW83_18340 [Tissierella sp. P1]
MAKHNNEIETIKIVMDSGKEYTVKNWDVEKFLENFCYHKDGSLINGFVYLHGYAINPSHISSIEYDY